MKILFIFLIFFVSCTEFTKTEDPAPYIETKILLTESASSLTIIPEGHYIITIGDKSIYTSGVLRFQISPKGIKLNNTDTAVNQIEIRGINNFCFGKKKYRGSFNVHRTKNKLQLVNHLHLEEYLYSVIPAEVYTSWSIDALRSQAIASRTYALYQIKQNRLKYPDRTFDLYSDTRSQVYLGVKSENAKTTQAVNDTAGEVLTYDQELIKSYFSASIGTKSASGSEIKDQQPYLQSRNFQLKNVEHPHSSWSIILPLDNIQKKFALKSPVKSVKVVSRTSSGRIDEVLLVDAANNKKIVKGTEFRDKIGNSVMKSTYASILLSKNKIKINGQGFGHGVGLGQWEAQELAKRGVPYPKILTYFYKGSLLSKIY